MDNNKARWLLENLLDRLVGREDGKQELPGIITESEQEALTAAIDLLGVSSRLVSASQETKVEPVDPDQQDDLPIYTVASGLPEVLLKELDFDHESLRAVFPPILDEPVSPDIRLCIDFGTAMSKVTLVHDGAGKNGGDELQILELGDVAGQDPSDGPLELLISSVYISNEGVVYFGKSALEVSEQEASEANRQRIDNMKRFLSEDGIEDVLSAEFNPTEIEVHYRDIILYYLVYLTWVFNHCTDDMGYDKNVLRRFAMPCFDDIKARQYSQMLSRMLGHAQVIAILLGDEINEGVPLYKLKGLCNSIHGKNYEYSFIGSPVTEPLGVASALVSEDGAANNLSMVIDIGAGTTDISLFRIRVDTDKDIYLANQIPEAASGLPMAGNYIDRVLVQKVLSLADVSFQLPDYRRIRNDLERKIRMYKEELFEMGSVNIPLPNGDVIEVLLDDFMESPSIHEFHTKLREKIVEVLENVDEFVLRTAPRRELVLVLTGGGASLPFVRNMIGIVIDVGNISLKTVKSHDFPAWMEEDHPEFEYIFPRIAVALGGARNNIIVPYNQRSMELSDA
ncbi:MULTISPECIES: hypothetical protein [Cobetia]|uniref:hypothetical protein n=1 Tax=Cobetia TaxID=204286 RepID=UPI001582862F|nr:MULTISPECIES: hypothetical protein [Cobetia]MDI4662612.1 hypothetical protein [Cobetia sp. BMC6]NUJ57826.1 hypothetical protein [Cobetia marina]